MMVPLLLLLVLLGISNAEPKPLVLGKTEWTTVPKKNWTYFSYNPYDDNHNETLKFTVVRGSAQGQEIVYIRKGALPTRIIYDEIDAAESKTHVIQFIPGTFAGTYYFAIYNLWTVDATYEVTLSALSGKTPVFTFEGSPFSVCEGISPPMYGPPSISLGLTSFAVACAQRAEKSRARVEFRKFNGDLLRSDVLRVPRGGLWAEPAVSYIKGTYQLVSSYEFAAFSWLNLRSYEQDGTLIQNSTTWGEPLLPETREAFPNIIWNGTSTLVYWHFQYAWYSPFFLGFNLRGEQVRKPDYIYEPRYSGDGKRLHASRVRATWNKNVATDVDAQVGIFTWEGTYLSELSFCVQTDQKTVPRRSITIIPGGSWVNETHGGIDMTVTSKNEYVLVHPVSADTVQITLMSSGAPSTLLNSIRVKHNAAQPNLVTVDNLVFLTTEFNGIGFITVLNEKLEIIASEPIGGGAGRRMSSPIVSYQSLLDLFVVLYTDPVTHQAMVQRLTVTIPEIIG